MDSLYLGLFKTRSNLTQGEHMLRSIQALRQGHVLVLAAVIGASSFAAAAAPKERAVVKGLAKQDAERRRSAIDNVRYDLSFTLSDKEADKDFSGTTVVRFDVRDMAIPLTLDFQDGKVLELTVNGVRQTDVRSNEHFITLPALKLGANEVTVKYEHPYSSTGAGLYRFKDPEDGKSYVYTDFEPYDANSLFPSFDQPDLKATYKVTVDAPADWTIVTSVRESAPPAVKGDRATWTFPESAKFSTYLFSLIGGPYQVWEGKAGDMPLRLLARPALGKFVPAAEWLKVTQQGFEFYNAYFDFAYPFKKYDQIVVPDFNAGAMENVAAVTFSERFVPRGAETTAEREDRADVILHEMAHMWFGNLVTMRWWNDLWLNESFATYMAALASVEGTEFKRAWETFYTSTKQWAYWEDQLVTTHPIEGDVPDTEQAFANFDGITYGKGASTLKALAYFIGPDQFRDGVRAYFKTHAYANTELKDFIAALAKSSGKNLDNWANDWLRTAGLNTVEARFACVDGKVNGFTLQQTAPADLPTLRSHKAKVALFSKSAEGKIELQKTVEVEYSGAQTAVAALDGEACPHIVYPNFEDYDFVKVRFDERSLAAVKKDLASVVDPLQRSMYWTALWDAVRDGEWSVVAYVETVLQQVGRETDDKILEKVLDSVHGGRRSTATALYYLTPDSAERLTFVKAFEALAADKLAVSAPGSDAQKLWFDFYVRVAESAPAKAQLVKLLAGDKKIAGMDVDQDRRWNIVARLSELGFPDALTLRIAESKRDGSSRGKQSAITVETLEPKKSVKTAWYGKIIDTKTKLSLADLKAAMAGMFPASQIKMSKDFSRRYFSDLPRLATVRENEFLRRFASNLAPTTCDEDSAKSLTDFAATHRDLPPVALKAIRVAAQEDGRCVRIRKVARAPQRI